MASQYYTPLSNGLQSFADASPEYVFAEAGIGSFQEQASRLAEFGRNGDIYVVHAAEGETVIPTEVLDANPKVRELLYEQMRGMGLDPQEYVVGNELNSLNPVTGMPEFFFKSIFKSVKKAFKKVGKAAKKWAPLVLPVAAAMFGVPFLGPAFGAGTFGASFLGSGIGSLIGGASAKDSLKAGLTAGATTAAFSGLSGAFSKTGTFAGGVKGSLTGKMPVFTPGQFDKPTGFQMAASPYADSQYSLNVGGYSPAERAAASGASDAQLGMFKDFDVFGGAKSGTTFDPTSGTNLSPGYISADIPKAPGAVNFANNPLLVEAQTPAQAQAQAQTDLYNSELDRMRHPGRRLSEMPTPAELSRRQAYNRALTPTNNLAPEFAADPASAMRRDIETRGGKIITKAAVPAVSQSVLPTGVTADDLTAWQVAQQYTPYAEPEFILPDGNVLRGTDAKIAAEAAGSKAYRLSNPELANTEAGLKGAAAAGRRAIADIAPTYTQQYALPVLGGIAAYAAFNEDPEKQELANLEDERRQRNSLLEETPEDFVSGNLDPFTFSTRKARDLIVPTTYPYQMRANQGGLAQYPRREMLVEGPGTERSDDIPAMLSDGEFVLNARSVRGADPTGQGNRYRGAQNLYSMMRDFEMRA